MRNNYKPQFYYAALILFVLAFSAANSLAGVESQKPLWKELATDSQQLRGRVKNMGDKYKVFKLDVNQLKAVFAQAPLEFSEVARQTETILEIPMPNGEIVRFRIEESPVFAPQVARQFPNWKTFTGRGVDDPTATARFDFNANGFHGYVVGATGSFFIDPYSLTDQKNYVIYYKGDLGINREPFACNFGGRETERADLFAVSAPQAFSNGTQLRTYRLAVSASRQYTNFFGGSQANALAAIQTTVNRMIVIYRRELATTFTIVSDLRSVFTDANTGGFTNNSNADTDRNQVVLDMIYGNAAYDIGHVFSVTPNPDGLAASPSLCDPTGKAQGFTGAPTPQGDAYDVDYVAHEIGHQFAMSHTFNNDFDGSCNTRSATSAYEPASGVTIMGYAGICTPRNISANSIEYFNLRSFDQSLNYLQTTVPQQYPTCGTTTATNNIAPTVNAGGNYNIPKQTPFTLTAGAIDANGDALTYSWEEFDLGGATRSTAAVDTDEDGTARPIFRAYNPTASPSRTFPSLYYILNNSNTPPPTYIGTLPFAPTVGSTNGYRCSVEAGTTCITGERLPSIARTMNFRVTVRDNNAAGGGVADAQATLTVAGNAGPFKVTTQNTATAWQGNSVQTITWDVANTNIAPVNTATVDVLLSTDGGQTFPIMLSPNTPNDGTEQITIPNVVTTTARIKIQAVGNIYFDINDANFSINAPANAVRAPFDFDGDGRTDIAVFRPASGNWYLNRSSAGMTAIQFGATGDLIAPADYDGDGKTDIAVFRPSNGTWYRLNSSINTFSGVQFGQNGDKPLPADYDGDGKADVNVFRPSTGVWYRLNSTDNQAVTNPFGQTGDIPVVGDFDGNGRADLAVFRPSEGHWYVAKPTGVPAQNFDVYNFGAATDIPVPANYDGDAKTDIAVFRPLTGVWYRINSSNGQNFAVQFGQNGDVPVAGDYDGDGKADTSIFRPSNGAWYSQNSQTGFLITVFGANSDKPVPSAFIN